MFAQEGATEGWTGTLFQPTGNPVDMSDEDPGSPTETPADLAWETTESRTGYTCPGFDIITEDVVLPDGTETDYDFLHDDPAVVILPFTPEENLVVIDEWRHAVKRVNTGFPAGSLEADDEDLAVAARRELEEETGYVAGEMTYLDSFEPANGISDAIHHYFVARECRPDGEQDLDFNESIQVRETALDALREQLREGEIQDGRTALGLLLYEFLG